MELNEQEYQYFSTHLLVDAPFIRKNHNLLGYDADGEGHHCLLITTPTGSEALAVDSSGYDYARYTAYIPDKAKLELDGIPVERFGAYPTKQPKDRSGGER